MRIRYTYTKEDLDELYNCSALTFEGCKVNKENIDFLTKWLVDNGVNVDNMELVVTNGKLMNETYDLRSSNAYKNDLTIISVVNISNIGGIILKRFELGGYWFDDIVDNNIRRNELV